MSALMYNKVSGLSANWAMSYNINDKLGRFLPEAPRTVENVYKGAPFQQYILPQPGAIQSVVDTMAENTSMKGLIDISPNIVEDPEETTTVYEAFGFCKELPPLGLGPVLHDTAVIKPYGTEKVRARICPIPHAHPSPAQLGYLQIGEASSLEGRDIDEKKLQQLERIKTQNTLRYLNNLKESIAMGDNHTTLFYNWLLSIYHLKLGQEFKVSHKTTFKQIPAIISSLSFPTEDSEAVKSLSYKGRMMRYLPSLKGKNYQAIDLFVGWTINERKELITLPHEMSPEQFAHLFFVLTKDLATSEKNGKPFNKPSPFSNRKVELMDKVAIVLDEQDNPEHINNIVKNKVNFSLDWKIANRMLEQYVAFYDLEDQLQEAKVMVIESLLTEDDVFLPMLQHNVDWTIRMHTPLKQTSGRSVCMPSENLLTMLYYTQNSKKKMKQVISDRIYSTLLKAGVSTLDADAPIIVQSILQSLNGSGVTLEQLTCKALCDRNQTFRQSGRALGYKDLFDCETSGDELKYNLSFSSFLGLGIQPTIPDLLTAMKKGTYKDWQSRTLTDAQYQIGKALYMAGVKASELGNIVSRHWAEPEMKLNLGDLSEKWSSKRQINMLPEINSRERKWDKYTADLQMIAVTKQGQTDVEVESAAILRNPQASVIDQLMAIPQEPSRLGTSAATKFAKARAKKEARIEQKNIQFKADREKFTNETIHPGKTKLTTEYNSTAEMEKTELPIDGMKLLTGDTTGLTENGGYPFDYTYDPPRDGLCGWHCLTKLVGFNTYEWATKLEPEKRGRLTTAMDMIRAAKKLGIKIDVEEWHFPSSSWRIYRDVNNQFEYKGTLIAFGAHFFLNEDTNRKGGGSHSKQVKSRAPQPVVIHEVKEEGYYVPCENQFYGAICHKKEKNTTSHYESSDQAVTMVADQKAQSVAPGKSGTIKTAGMMGLTNLFLRRRPNAAQYTTEVESEASIENDSRFAIGSYHESDFESDPGNWTNRRMMREVDLNDSPAESTWPDFEVDSVIEGAASEAAEVAEGVELLGVAAESAEVGAAAGMALGPIGMVVGAAVAVGVGFLICELTKTAPVEVPAPVIEYDQHKHDVVDRMSIALELGIDSRAAFNVRKAIPWAWEDLIVYIQRKYQTIQYDVGLLDQKPPISTSNMINFSNSAQAVQLVRLLWEDYDLNHTENIQGSYGGLVQELIYNLVPAGYQVVLLRRDKPTWIKFYDRINQGPPVYFEGDGKTMNLVLLMSDLRLSANPDTYFQHYPSLNYLPPVPTETRGYSATVEYPDTVVKYTLVGKVYSKACPPHLAWDSYMGINYYDLQPAQTPAPDQPACSQLPRGKKTCRHWQFWVPATFPTSKPHEVSWRFGMRYLLHIRGKECPGYERIEKYIKKRLASSTDELENAKLYASRDDDYEFVIPASDLTLDGHNRPIILSRN
jgi:hypothetical protein